MTLREVRGKGTQQRKRQSPAFLLMLTQGHMLSEQSDMRKARTVSLFLLHPFYECIYLSLSKFEFVHMMEMH